MRWDFEGIPLTVRIDEKTVVHTGMFSGSFEVDELGVIQTIWIDETPPNNQRLELKRWKPGQPSPGFKGRLFDALAATLEKRYAEGLTARPKRDGSGGREGFAIDPPGVRRARSNA